jgi:hypothetical protein
MNENFKRLTIWTIVLSFLIIIAAGHGIACVGLLEIIGLLHKFNVGTEDFSLSFTASYDKSLSATALFALFGQILLIISIASKSYKIMFWTKVFGLIFSWLSFFYLTHNILGDDLSQIGFMTGLPFVIVSILLAYKILRQEFRAVSE